jgi:hypothetical protein
MQNNEILWLAELYKMLREQKTESEEQLKELNAQIEQIVFKLSELMLESDMPGFKHDGSQFSLVTTTRASAIAGDKTELFNALRDNGFGDLVYETVNANSLSSFVREQIEANGDKLPDWLVGKVNVFEKTGVSLKKSK